MQEWLTGEQERAALLQPFGSFQAFVASYSGQASPAFASSRELEEAGTRIALLGFNSALMCGRRRNATNEVDDYGVLTLGEPQIHELLSRMDGANLRISIVHHPFEWLHEYDRIRVELALRRGSDLILSGHVHRPGVAIEQRPQSGTVVIPAGASYDRRNPEGVAYANGYNLVSLDLANGKGIIYLRRWDDQNSRWAPDHATSPDGKYSFQVPRLKQAAQSRRRPSARTTSAAERQAAAAKTYRRRLLESCDLLELANLPSDHLVAQRDLKLRQLFIPTRVIVEPEISPSEDNREGQEKRLAAWESERDERFGSRGTQKRTRAEIPMLSERVPPGQCLRRSPRLMLLGDPGSGKTTFTRWLALACLLRQEQSPLIEGLADLTSLPSESLEPILIRCRDLEQGDERRSVLSLLHRCYRADALTEVEARDLGDHLRVAIRAGRALLIVDGLDEIPEATRRNAFCEKVLDLARDYPALRIVATSRIVGYRETGHRLRHKFLHARVDDLSREEKDRFATDWCALTEPPERRVQAAADLIGDIHGNERIERLTGSPILLTTMALVRRSIGQLPQRRVELYPKAIEVLLNWRSAVDLPLDSREAYPQLAYLAYEMCAHGVSRLDERTVLAALQTMREQFPNLEDIRRQTPAAFLRQVEARTALLIQAGHERLAGQIMPVYEFRHLSFQEYLAAWSMVHGYEPGFRAGRSLAGLIGDLAARATVGTTAHPAGDSASTWTEVIRLCIADCPHAEVDPCLQVILGEEGVQRATLAAMCLADEPQNVAPATAERILHNVVSYVSHGFTGRDLRRNALIALGATRWRVPLLKLLLEGFASARAESMWYVEAAQCVETGDSRELTPARLIEKLAHDLEPEAFGALAASRLLFSFSVLVDRQFWSQVEHSTILALLASRLRGSPGIRRAAAEALGNLRDAAAVPDLRQRLREDDASDMRLAAAAALDYLGDTEGRITFDTALADPRQRDAALAAFSRVVGAPDGYLLTRDGDGLAPFLPFGAAITRPMIREIAAIVGVTEAHATEFYRRVAPRFALQLPS